jgi:hypothetical protein
VNEADRRTHRLLTVALWLCGIGFACQCFALFAAVMSLLSGAK